VSFNLEETEIDLDILLAHQFFEDTGSSMMVFPRLHFLIKEFRVLERIYTFENSGRFEFDERRNYGVVKVAKRQILPSAVMIRKHNRMLR
jgi:hypothetical protein